MKRAIVTIAACILIVTVLLDPYTLHRNGSDAIVPAPQWQIGLTDILLLAVVVRFAWLKQVVCACGP